MTDSSHTAAPLIAVAINSWPSPPHSPCAQFSNVHKDTLHNFGHTKHPCLQSPYPTLSALSRTHPANLGVMMCTFRDGVAQLEGHAVQIMITGTCLNDDCNKMATVALHPYKNHRPILPGILAAKSRVRPRSHMVFRPTETVKTDLPGMCLDPG